jgi:hypothetical protein
MNIWEAKYRLLAFHLAMKLFTLLGRSYARLRHV